MLVDIHCHILPGVDDGAPDMETSRAMIRDAYEQGVRYIIATPHYRPEMFEPSMKKVIRVYHELRDYADCLPVEFLGIGRVDIVRSESGFDVSDGYLHIVARESCYKCS